MIEGGPKNWKTPQISNASIEQEEKLKYVNFCPVEKCKYLIFWCDGFEGIPPIFRSTVHMIMCLDFS